MLEYYCITLFSYLFAAEKFWQRRPYFDTKRYFSMHSTFLVPIEWMVAKIYLSFVGKYFIISLVSYSRLGFSLFINCSQYLNWIGTIILYVDICVRCTFWIITSHITLSFIAYSRVIKLTQMLMVKYTQTRPHNYFDLQTPLFCPSDLAESMSS